MELETRVWAFKQSWSKELGYALSESDMSTEGWVEVKAVIISFEPITMEQFAGEAVPNLRKKIQEIHVRARDAVVKVEEEINELLALDYKPEVL